MEFDKIVKLIHAVGESGLSEFSFEEGALKISMRGGEKQGKTVEFLPKAVEIKEEIKEKLKIFITRYQAKEAKEQIQYYRKGEISEEERNILKEIEVRIDQLDFDEAEILMKRWEGME